MFSVPSDFDSNNPCVNKEKVTREIMESIKQKQAGLEKVCEHTNSIDNGWPDCKILLYIYTAIDLRIWFPFNYFALTEEIWTLQTSCLYRIDFYEGQRSRQKKKNGHLKHFRTHFQITCTNNKFTDNAGSCRHNIYCMTYH